MLTLQRHPRTSSNIPAHLATLSKILSRILSKTLSRTLSKTWSRRLVSSSGCHETRHQRVPFVVGVPAPVGITRMAINRSCCGSIWKHHAEINIPNTYASSKSWAQQSSVQRIQMKAQNQDLGYKHGSKISHGSRDLPGAAGRATGSSRGP